MSEDFVISQEETGFAKVRKLCFLCSCKQTRETSTSQRRDTSRVIRLRQLAEVRKKCLLCLKYGYFSNKKCMDLLQEAFSHPPELCEACFIMDGCRGACRTPNCSPGAVTWLPTAPGVCSLRMG